MRFKINKKKLVIGVWIIFFIVVGFIIANGRNMITGYSTYSKIQEGNYTLEEYGNTVSELNAEAQLLTQQVSNLSAELDSKQAELQKTRMIAANCNKEFGIQQDELNRSAIQQQFELGILNSKLEKADKRFEALRNDYDSLVENTAKSICCKQKIDQPDIRYYGVDGDKIVCSEDKGTRLSCSFD